MSVYCCFQVKYVNSFINFFVRHPVWIYLIDGTANVPGPMKGLIYCMYDFIIIDRKI